MEVVSSRACYGVQQSMCCSSLARPPPSTYLASSRASCLQSVLCALLCSSEPLCKMIKHI